jgi:hypothetical protein
MKMSERGLSDGDSDGTSDGLSDGDVEGSSLGLFEGRTEGLSEGEEDGLVVGENVGDLEFNSHVSKSSFGSSEPPPRFASARPCLPLAYRLFRQGFEFSTDACKILERQRTLKRSMRLWPSMIWYELNLIKRQDVPTTTNFRS